MLQSRFTLKHWKKQYRYNKQTKYILNVCNACWHYRITWTDEMIQGYIYRTRNSLLFNALILYFGLFPSSLFGNKRKQMYSNGCRLHLHSQAEMKLFGWEGSPLFRHKQASHLHWRCLVPVLLEIMEDKSNQLWERRLPFSSSELNTIGPFRQFISVSHAVTNYSSLALSL